MAKNDIQVEGYHVVTKDMHAFSDLELQALSNFKKKDDMAFWKADNGSRAVILDKNDYITEAHNKIFNDNITSHLKAQCA